MFRVLITGFLLFISNVAIPQSAPSSEIPLKVVDGRLIVVVTLTNELGDTNEVALQVSFESPEVLVLHGDQREWLQGGAKVRVALMPDMEVSLPLGDVKVEDKPKREQAQNRLTAHRSAEMGEVALKGMLGVGFLRRYRVTIDVAAGKMHLNSPGGGILQGEQIVAFGLKDGRLWLPLVYDGSKTGHLLLGGDEYDTTVSRRLAREMNKPAGDIGTVRVGTDGQAGLELAQDFAFRPRSFVDDEDSGNDAALLIAGVNLFDVYRVEIDWNESRMAFTRQHEARYPQADFEFFQAEAGGKPGDMLAYLERHPNARLSTEAARYLMQWRVEEHGTDEELVTALQWVVDTAPPDRRLETCMEYIRAFAAMPGRTALVRQAGDMALKHSRGSVVAQDTYRLHNLIGEALLKEGELTEAWKHLLSAAFMPLDNESDLEHNLAVNLNLARVYDKQGRIVRAYSRYKKAHALMSVKRRDQPTLAEIADMDESGVTEGQRVKIESVRTWRAEIDSALKRLRPQIPAGNRVLLEG